MTFDRLFDDDGWLEEATAALRITQFCKMSLMSDKEVIRRVVELKQRGNQRPTGTVEERRQDVEEVCILMDQIRDRQATKLEADCREQQAMNVLLQNGFHQAAETLKNHKEAKKTALSNLLDAEDVWKNFIFPSLGVGHYAFVGRVNRRFNVLYREYCETYQNTNDPPVAFYNVICARYFLDDASPSVPSREQVCPAIAKCGSRAVMEWANEMAAKHSHVGLIQWTRNTNLYPTKELFRASVELQLRGFVAGANHQNVREAISIAILKWARRHGCPWDESTCIAAAAAGHLHIVQWACVNGCRFCIWSTCTAAARAGHLAILQWARENGLHWNEETCAAAARGGHLALLQWARANHCPWNEYTCAAAAGRGHLAILQWARANHCPWTEETCFAAAQGGHLAILQWARANHFPWNQDTCTAAARKGHLAILQGARANHCPWDWKTRLWSRGHPQVLQWAIENGCPA
ncbi:ankyrin repeat protein [Seminavis robusta]|uniref:Ankyrin repeat protein n=1 Tax=Seminavis robusta TaxID=568900 RepID=A0A9N8DQ24_9STRA|nr:ankyrin repeat protein [Seminavis robusta]|eukprot:Sro290_g109270.1 ankyrin repeat protein (465) ;mRNA; r:21090-22751